MEKTCGKRGKERSSSVLGVYHQTGEYHNEKPVWSRHDGTKKIYYSYGKLTFTEITAITNTGITGSIWVAGGLWKIGRDPATDSGDVTSTENSQNHLPHQIWGWQYYDEGSWLTDPFLTVTGNNNFFLIYCIY